MLGCFFGYHRCRKLLHFGVDAVRLDPTAPQVMPVNSLNLETCTATVQGSTFEAAGDLVQRMAGGRHRYSNDSLVVNQVVNDVFWIVAHS